MQKPSNASLVVLVIAVLAAAYMLFVQAPAAVPVVPAPEEVVVAPVVIPEPAPIPVPVVVPKTPIGAVILSGTIAPQGIALSWTLKNGFAAPYGYIVLRGTAANPTWPTAEMRNLFEPAARTYAWEGKDGRLYHFRICTWNGKEGKAAACAAYSNDLAITAPTVDQALNAGLFYFPLVEQLQITVAPVQAGVSLRWTAATGSSFKEYRVLRSEDDADPYWPKSTSVRVSVDRTSLDYLDTGASHGRTYYYRVCAVQKSGLPLCGNVVKFTFSL